MFYKYFNDLCFVSGIVAGFSTADVKKDGDRLTLVFASSDFLWTVLYVVLFTGHLLSLVWYQGILLNCLLIRRTVVPTMDGVQ